MTRKTGTARLQQGEGDASSKPNTANQMESKAGEKPDRLTEVRAELIKVLGQGSRICDVASASKMSGARVVEIKEGTGEPAAESELENLAQGVAKFERTPGDWTVDKR